jgi:hypothetical protein
VRVHLHPFYILLMFTLQFLTIPLIINLSTELYKLQITYLAYKGYNNFS